MARVNFRGQLWKGGSSKAVRTAIKRVVPYAKQQLELQNRQLAYRSGAMSRSWTVEPTRNGIVARNSQKYSGYIVNGTRRIRPRPIVSNAMEDIKDKFRAEYNKEIKKL